jgi:hypothetical protein
MPQTALRIHLSCALSEHSMSQVTANNNIAHFLQATKYSFTSVIRPEVTRVLIEFPVLYLLKNSPVTRSTQ